jgi:nucleoside-diphosphate-sugar epimerase
MSEQRSGVGKVLVTGAAGVIGTAVREHLAGRFDLAYLTHRPQPFPSHVADIADLDAIRPAFAGIDAVVHLAASPAVETPWEDVLPNNIVGTRNVFKAAREAGVRRVVFASSNHAIGMNEIDNAPGLYELDDPRVWDEFAEPRPDSFYGVSKLFGEALGRMYHDLHGIEVVNLRIGTVRADDDPASPKTLTSIPAPLAHLTHEERRKRTRATWLSRRDCAELIARALEADADWAIVYGISDNPRQFWSLRSAREVLGFAPRDSAPV